MTNDVRALVLSGNGTNCERETAHACRLAGADVVQILSVWDLLAGEGRLDDFDLLCLPGGFTDGDDLGAAQAAANRLRYSMIAKTGTPLVESLDDFVKGGKLIIGICNGFQLLVKLGLLPFADFEPQLTLTFNKRGRFEARWVELAVDHASPCVFTRGIHNLPLPIRHGEGRLVLSNPSIGIELLSQHLVPLRYADPTTGHPTDNYPANPNGSWSQAAAICDPSGRVFGLMPHPEAFHSLTNHPRWTRAPSLEEGFGVRIFRNAIDHLRLWKR
jgi:phosphoribosylformylglycinamidine synthase subunit PurQ / glutaminase